MLSSDKKALSHLPLVVTSAEGEAVKYEGEGPFVFEGIFHVVD